VCVCVCVCVCVYVCVCVCVCVCWSRRAIRATARPHISKTKNKILKTALRSDCI